MFDVVVLNYEKPGLLNKCLNFLRKSGLKPISDKIFIVDNGSEDSSVIAYLEHLKKEERLREEEGRAETSIIVIENEINLGCSRGRNVGAMFGENPFIVFIDNDVFVYDEWLTVIKNVFEDSTVGIVGLKAVDSQGRITGGGFTDKKRIEKGRCWHLPNGDSILNQNEKVLYVNGACFAVRRSLFEKMGGFDESFIFWYEDSDFCLRAKRDFNADTLFVGSFYVDHDCNSTSLSPWCLGYLNQSRKLFYQRWGDFLKE